MAGYSGRYSLGSNLKLSIGLNLYASQLSSYNHLSVCHERQFRNSAPGPAGSESGFDSDLASRPAARATVRRGPEGLGKSIGRCTSDL